MRRLILTSVILLLLVGLTAILLLRKGAAPQRVPLANGKIVQIEAVTYGTNHQVGVRSVILDWFGPWLPPWLWQTFQPRFPRSHLTTDHPALVLWLNAIDATGQSVDCQQLRVEFVDEHGECFGEGGRHWFGIGNFSRVGHIFEAYPRHQSELTLQITSWLTNGTSATRLRNPQVRVSTKWQGEPVPAKRAVRQMEVVLRSLIERTNAAEVSETRTRYWEPTWELWRRGEIASGWGVPEWVGEDGTGNRGKYLGVHQPVLRYSVTFYPSETNLDAARLIGRLPQIAVEDLQTNIFWNTNLNFESTRMLVLGVFPAGVTTFTDGAYDPKPAVALTPVVGGSPSGWTGTSRYVTPTRERHWDGHYTPVPTLYIKAAGLRSDCRIGVRLRDEQGRWWVAKPEPQGIRDDICPFLIELPPEIKLFTPEVVMLEPVQATFQVRTRALPPEGQN